MTAITTQGYTGIAGRNEMFDIPVSNPTFVNALDGHDIIIAFGHADTLYGGLGRDVIRGLAGNDAIYGDQFWNDETTNANPLLAAGADALFGQEGADTIFAGGGNNYVNGGSDDD
jgi:Ca2+-binding RTX toxin-like protein